MKRYFLLFLALLPMGLNAQPRSASNYPPGIPTFQLSATAIDLENIPELFWQDYQLDARGEPIREFQPLPIALNRRSRKVELPLVPPVRIFRQLPDESMQPLFEVPAKAGDDILVLFHRNEDGRPKRTFINDAPEAHPPQTVRIMNLSPNSVAASIGGSPTVIQPGEAPNLGMPNYYSGRRFEFQFASQEPDGTLKKEPAKRFVFRQANSRMLVIYTTFAVLRGSPEDPDGQELVYEPVAYYLFDQSEGTPPPPPTRGGQANANARPEPSMQRPNAEVRDRFSFIYLGDGSARFAYQLGEARAMAQANAGELLPLAEPAQAASEIEMVAPSGDRQSASVGANWEASLFVAVTPSEGNFTLQAFENSAQSHPDTTLRLFNLTPYQLAYAVDQEVKYLSPMQETLLRAEAPGASVELSLALKTPEGWTRVFQGNQTFPEARSRSGLFVHETSDPSVFNMEVIEL